MAETRDNGYVNDKLLKKRESLQHRERHGSLRKKYASRRGIAAAVRGVYVTECCKPAVTVRSLLNHPMSASLRLGLRTSLTLYFYVCFLYFRVVFVLLLRRINK